MEVVKTTAAGHARKLAATVDINTCPDGKSRMLFYALVFFFECCFSLYDRFTGIVCVGGDGIINEVSHS